MHEREESDERSFWRWLLMPLLNAITLSRNELADFRKEVFRRLSTMESKMAIEFDRLANEVGEMESVVDSAVEVLKKLAAEIRLVAGNEAASKALADRLDAKAGVLGAAIEESTPADPETPPAPPAEPPV